MKLLFLFLLVVAAAASVVGIGLLIAWLVGKRRR